MDQLTTDLDQLRMASLTWGPVSDPAAPLAVLLHGFPDTAHTWRHLGPELAAGRLSRGRPVHPRLRSERASGRRQLPRPGADERRARAARRARRGRARRTHRTRLGRHHGNGVAAYDGSPFRRVVSMAVPPFAAMNPSRARSRGGRGSCPARPAELVHVFNQLPALPERNFDKLVARLWGRWSPGYAAGSDLAHLADSVATAEQKAAVIGYYRAGLRPWQTPRVTGTSGQAALGMPRVPLLYLQGADDGCLDARWAAQVSGDSTRGPRRGHPGCRPLPPARAARHRQRPDPRVLVEQREEAA